MTPLPQRLRRLALTIPLAISLQTTAAVTAATMVSSALFPEYLECKVVGICSWLFCTQYGCKVKTSTKVRHLVPKAVVSSCADTGENPWTEMASLSSGNRQVAASYQATCEATSTDYRSYPGRKLGHGG